MSDRRIPALEARFQGVRFLLNRELPFLAHLLNRVPPRFAPVETARSRDTGEWGEIFFDPGFAERLSDAQLGTVWAHEVLHLALGFFHRRGGRDLRRFNQAHDYAINLALDDFIRAHPGLLAWTTGDLSPYLDRAFEGMSAEAIYEHLQREGPTEEETPESGSQGYPDASDCEEDPDIGTSAQNAQARNWQIALAEASQWQAIQGAGDLPAHLEVLLDQALKPRAPWAERLLMAVDGHLRGGRPTFARPSRRGRGMGVILPGVSRRRLRLGVVLDTSASVSEDEVRAFLGVVRGLGESQTLSLRVLQVDAAIQVDEDIEDLDAWMEGGVRVQGRGGTDFAAVPEALERNPSLEPVDLALLFTDGEPLGWPVLAAWPCPVVVVTTRTPPPEPYEFVRLDLEPTPA